ncbi:MAG: transporter substrate-binding domain-containing protein [Chlorobi bacterium]|nr:transporter substrate-binding domain-containing protein [Chlorobiota bacterium]
MMRFVIIILISALFLVSCNSGSTGSKKDKNTLSPDPKNQALNRVLKNKKLRAVTDYSSVNYLIYRGQPIGYQYELLKNFTDYLGVQLEMVIEKDLEKSIRMLNDGEVDLMAMTLTVTGKRKKQFTFTDPIMITEQVLVQRLPDNYQNMKTRDEIESHLLRNQIDLAGKTVYVQKGTIFAQRLAALANEIGDTIYIIEEDKDVEELIEAVARGEIDYTVADKYIALINTRYYPNIDVKTEISFPQYVAWAVKKGQTGLADTINVWLDSFKKTLLFRLIYNKYFRNIRAAKIVKSKYNSFSGGHLSPYDDYIKEASRIVGWDWRLLASMIYQESEFKPNVRSWVGAYGLMQLMPETLKKYGLDTLSPPKDQIVAGAKYLRSLERQLPAEVTDSVERIKFVLASYNAGLGHILDARRLAVKYGRDPNVWEDNVDFFVKNLSDKFYYHDEVVRNGYLRGDETYNFVNEIFDRFEDYKNLIKD